MTTTAVFSVSRDQIFTQAMQIMKVLGQGAAPSTNDKTDLGLLLNAMLKLWNTDGYKGWLYQNITFAAIAGKTSYTIGESGADVITTRPVRVASAYTLDANNNKIPLNPWTKQQFDMATPSNQPGPSNSYYYQPTLVLGTFYPWPIPTDTSRSFVVVAQRPIYDISAANGADTFDVPQELYLALSWGLADLAGLIYGVDKTDRDDIKEKAQLFKATAMDFDEEDGPVYFQPNMLGGFNRGR